MSDSADKRIFTPDFGFIALCFAIGLVGFGYILTSLPSIADTCPNAAEITGIWKYGLVSTHILTFALIPVAMRIFYEGLKNLQVPSKSIFASQLGLGFVMVAIAGEIGWHVTQGWYYANDFTMLNFMFYFFLISAFALWAGGLVEQETVLTRISNAVFALGLLAVSILYPMGAKVGNDSCKIPIYILMTLVFAVLTYRGYKLLKDWKIVFVPLLSVGVNLTFIMLLDKYGGDPCSDPQVVYNAFFHILHDLAGTLAGVAVFTWLVYDKGIANFKPESEAN
ncbi:hypothetical protein Lepto7376_3339 [[Leptolyngbya] sp. PCC 7376]|uniref:hypothetical protein n=1 Tax=[Leptolyngbya] sp. PCC 7376 TaxID=111781 RepID=UPI00029F405F|nr:hypothetical protein [[Leptolyngbya] sp. PCC 7376]AFY39556.1 hypothetical protein Lepto7376_3339 [[Leptolyngbya] sp. PCC 7376]